MTNNTHAAARCRWPRLVAAAFVAALVAAGAARGAGPPSIDKAKAAALKAACLPHLAEFTAWPEEAFAGLGAPVVIGIIGGDPGGLGPTLAQAARERQLPAVQGRAIELRTLAARSERRASGDDAELAGACHMLLVTAMEPGRWTALRDALEGRPVLTVSDAPGFAEDGGMIELALRPTTGRIVLRINMDAVDRAGLRLSARLLGLKEGVELLGVRARGVELPPATDPE